MEQVKMVIFRSLDSATMCKASDMHIVIHEDDLPITIEKIFNATTWNEAAEIFNDLQDYGTYTSHFPDTYLINGEEVK